MSTQQQKILAVVAVVLFHGAVITVMLAQHGCKSDGSTPSSADAPAPVSPPPVVAESAPTMPTAANNGFVEPMRPAPETPVRPVPVAQFADTLPLPQPAPMTALPVPSPTTPAPMTVTYVVSRGESWASIAKKNGISVDELVAANSPKMNKNTILQPNMSLNIPNAKTVTATSAPATIDSGSTYKVANGDNLGKIATKFHTTVKALQELNGMTSTNLRAGQVLKVPDGSSAPSMTKSSTSTSTAAVAPSDDGSTYTIKSGDSLDKISREVHVSVSELMNLNGLTATTARGLRPGHVLKLPAGAHASATAAPMSTTSSAPPPVSIFATPTPSSSSPPPVTTQVLAVPSSGSSAPPITPVQ